MGISSLSRILVTAEIHWGLPQTAEPFPPNVNVEPFVVKGQFLDVNFSDWNIPLCHLFLTRVPYFRSLQQTNMACFMLLAADNMDLQENLVLATTRQDSQSNARGETNSSRRLAVKINHIYHEKWWYITNTSTLELKQIPYEYFIWYLGTLNCQLYQQLYNPTTDCMDCSCWANHTSH